MNPSRFDLLPRCGLAIAAGVIDALGFIGFGLFPLTWVAKVPALVAVRDTTPRQAFLLGLLYGAVGHLGGYFWLYHTLVEFGGLPVIASVALLLLIAASFGLLFALLIWCVRRGQRDLGIAPVWSLMVAYPALELVFPNLFPYNIGASRSRFTAVTQIVEMTGLLGLTALIGMVNGATYELVDARLARRRIVNLRWAVPAAAFAFVVAYGVIRIRQVDASLAAARRATIAVVQTNLGGQEKMKRRAEDIDLHKTMTRELITAHSEVELVVWPETAVNIPIRRDVMDVRRQLEPQRPMIVGALTVARPRSYNSLLAVIPTGEVAGRFDKVRLLIFGETIPLVAKFPWLRKWFPRTGIYERGTTFENLRLAEITLMPTICYENIMPDFVRQMWRRAGPPEVLINVANDSWFGDSHEPLIHLALASFRSIETRRALIRSTNTGISAFVDPVGRIISRTNQWRQEVLVERLPLVKDRSTSLYLRIGDAFGWVCFVLTSVGVVAAVVSNRRRSPSPLA